MSFLSKIKAKRNLKENQVDKIFKQADSMRPLGEPYQLIDIEYSNIEGLTSIIGGDKLVQRLHVMIMIICKGLISPEEFVYNHDLLRRCNIDTMSGKDCDYVYVRGTLANFYKVAALGSKFTGGPYTKLSTFVCRCLASVQDYDIWHPEQKELLDNYLTSEVIYASDEVVDYVTKRFATSEDLDIVRLDYSFGDSSRLYAMAVADEFLLSQGTVSCFVRKCIACNLLGYECETDELVDQDIEEGEE